LPGLGQRGRHRDRDSPRDFDEFARGRQLGGATMCWISAAVRLTIDRARTALAESRALTTVASASRPIRAGRFCKYCSRGVLRIDVRVPAPVGTTRYVPGLPMSVHQIWLGDRANDAKARPTAQVI